MTGLSRATGHANGWGRQVACSRRAVLTKLESWLARFMFENERLIMQVMFG